MKGVAQLREVTDVLAQHPGLRCAPIISEEDGLVTLAITFYAQDTADALAALDLMNDLRYVADVAQVRAFADTYGLDARAFEALLQKRRLTDDSKCAEEDHRL